MIFFKLKLLETLHLNTFNVLQAAFRSSKWPNMSAPTDQRNHEAWTQMNAMKTEEKPDSHHTQQTDEQRATEKENNSCRKSPCIISAGWRREADGRWRREDTLSPEPAGDMDSPILLLFSCSCSNRTANNNSSSRGESWPTEPHNAAGGFKA